MLGDLAKAVKMSDLLGLSYISFHKHPKNRIFGPKNDMLMKYGSELARGDYFSCAIRLWDKGDSENELETPFSEVLVRSTHTCVYDVEDPLSTCWRFIESRN